MRSTPIPIAGLPALTLWPEWLPCFTVLDKRTENRGWHPPKKLLGHDLVLHAGKSVGGGSLKRGGLWLSDTAAEAGWNVDLLPGKPPVFVWQDPSGRTHRQDLVLGAAVCVGRLVSADTEQRTPWDIEGQVHWRFEDLRVLPTPVPLRGRQGLFTVGGC